MNSDLHAAVSNMFKSGKFPHAVLIYGEKGLGKKYAARQIAQLLLCQNSNAQGACRICTSCRLVQSDSHPDLIEAAHSGKKMGISVATVREICADSSVMPNTSDCKVYLFLDADAMEAFAQNALLKVIEEPPENVYFIFTAQSKSAFLPTVLSRLVSIGMGECSKDECLLALSEHKIEAQRAENAYSIYGGNIGKCLKSITDEKMQLVQNTVILLSQSIINGNSYEFLKVCHSIENDNNTVVEILQELALVFRDVSALRLNSHNCAGIYKKGALELSQKLSYNTINRFYNAVNSAYSDIKSNVSPKLVLCHLCSQIFA